MSIADRVRQKRTQHRLTQAELAKRVGITQQSLQKIEDGRTQNPRKLLNLAKELNCSPEWLQLGTTTEVRESSSHYSNDSAPPTSLSQHQRPIISVFQAAQWSNHSQAIEPQAYLDTPPDTSPSAFWLKVIGDSMTSTSGISIPEGYLILVEPDRTAKNGDLVVAKIITHNEVTFKKLVIDTGHTYLKPLNSNYRPIEVSEGLVIIGVVTQARVLF
ncbi:MULTISPECIES: LexA family protein [Marinomonas]|uniref:Helix-turn-helix domain-containing protein n=1 Tax=Marinomonas rhodophyticola TaxID=2992803 RepID=A0ABT3KM42_9GAMM|nr:S24 family peptidase [Marinomonas sp. KJ51-3]MCW4631629.1 helix-turn-helix domain-containing protein [Marinomonas sp. KJ51-3]